MSILRQKINEEFLARIAKSKGVNSGQIEQLQKLLDSGKKPKAEEFVRIYSQADGGENG